MSSSKKYIPIYPIPACICLYSVQAKPNLTQRAQFLETGDSWTGPSFHGSYAHNIIQARRALMVEAHVAVTVALAFMTY